MECSWVRAAEDSLQDGLEDGRPERGRGGWCPAVGSVEGELPWTWGWEPLGWGFPSVHLREDPETPGDERLPSVSAALP